MAGDLDSNQVISKVYDPANGALKIIGDITVSVTGTQAVSGTVSVDNFPDTQAVSGTISVDNFPETQAVSGTIDIGNLPTIQAVSGDVEITNTVAVTGSVEVSNFPANQLVTVDNFPQTQAVSGEVTVLNPVTTVSVDNFPATQAVSGTILVDTGAVFENQNVDSADIDGSGGSYHTVVASTSSETRAIAVYDTTGASLAIATGAASSETPALFLGPGDSGTYPVSIPAGTRISVRSLEAVAPGSGANLIVRLIG